MASISREMVRRDFKFTSGIQRCRNSMADEGQPCRHTDRDERLRERRGASWREQCNRATQADRDRIWQAEDNHGSESLRRDLQTGGAALAFNQSAQKAGCAATFVALALGMMIMLPMSYAQKTCHCQQARQEERQRSPGQKLSSGNNGLHAQIESTLRCFEQGGIAKTGPAAALFAGCCGSSSVPRQGAKTGKLRLGLTSYSSMRFFLIDRITQWKVGTSAEATKNVALSEDFFDDHFPRRPVMPGVLILEGMAQLSGLLLEASLAQKYEKTAKAVVTVLERTKFRALVKPGDRLTYRSEVLSVNEAGGKVKVVALREDSLVTSTEMVFAFKYVDDPQLDQRRRRLMEIWMAPDGPPVVS